MAYEINININSDVEDLGVASAPGVSGTQSASPKDKALKDLGKYVSAQTIEPIIQNVKTQISQNIGIATGNNELQQRVNFGFQTVQFGVNAYKNASAGAIVAKSAGLGGGVGAAIGVALTAISTAIEIAFNQQQINLQKRVENYQLQQLRDRKGFSYNKSRS